jgi:hypothetical protein
VSLGEYRYAEDEVKCRRCRRRRSLDVEETILEGLCTSYISIPWTISCERKDIPGEKESFSMSIKKEVSSHLIKK